MLNFSGDYGIRNYLPGEISGKLLLERKFVIRK